MSRVGRLIAECLPVIAHQDSLQSRFSEREMGIIFLHRNILHLALGRVEARHLRAIGVAHVNHVQPTGGGQIGIRWWHYHC